MRPTTPPIPQAPASPTFNRTARARATSKRPPCTRAALGLAVALGVLAGLAADAPATPPGLSSGAPVDVAPWGERASWADGRDIGLWWEDPRDIHRVVVTFTGTPPEPARVKLQWWHSQWPEHRVPRDQPAGAGESGWGHLGDLYQGEWRDADAYFEAEGRTWTWSFRHLNLNEFPQLKDFAAEYRTTMKIRLLFDGPAPALERLAAYTDSVWL
jgi:hypothetical protein